MSIRQLIEFVQGSYPTPPPIARTRDRSRNQRSSIWDDRDPHPDPHPDDQDAIQADRPPRPDWLRDEVEAIEIDDTDSLSIEAETVRIGAGSAPEIASGEAVGIDTLAYYLPYHFYKSRWGIYFRTSGILYLASLLKDGPLAPGDDHLLELARRILFEHEFFHFVAETACSRAEVVAKKPLYAAYYSHRLAAPHEEGLANAHAFRKAMRRQAKAIKKIVSDWMLSQGPGYRDYERWLAHSKFDAGCCRAARYMLEPISVVGRSPSDDPTSFLFAIPLRSSVPTRLVVDTGLGILKPFPKFGGMRIVVHTAEHPPAHIHIERPPGNVVTRLIWPDLSPYPGDKPLNRSAQKDLKRYLDRYRDEIGAKVLSVPSFSR
jgi:hypothetical protein